MGTTSLYQARILVYVLHDMVNTRTFISHSSTVSIHYSLEVLRANVSSSLLKLGFAHAYILQGLSGPGRWLLKLDVPALRNGSQFTLSPRILSTTTISNLTSTTALLRSMKGIIHISLWFFLSVIATYAPTILFTN